MFLFVLPRVFSRPHSGDRAFLLDFFFDLLRASSCCLHLSSLRDQVCKPPLFIERLLSYLVVRSTNYDLISDQSVLNGTGITAFEVTIFCFLLYTVDERVVTRVRGLLDKADGIGS